VTFQLPGKEEKADYVLRQFDRIAAKYDLANDLLSLGMHRRWKRRAAEELVRQSPDGSFLDVCTGTGDLALIIARRKGFRGTVIGLDFSPHMLCVGRQRSTRLRSAAGSLSFQEGNAERLPFPDNCFDGAIISFGLRNLTDLSTGIREMSRVVKAGGRVVSLDLGKPELPVFTPLFYFFFEEIVPLIGRWITQDAEAYNYLPASGRQYPHPLRISEIFAAAGLADIRFSGLAGGSVALHTGTVQ
jgi:demethylmenaquinone methyltransferase / 2-methoxy-6-polyprenyl-1,4-benzoquinol methylase